MFKSPNTIIFESKGGEGDIVFKGHIKAESIEATSLSAPELAAIATQIEEMRARIQALSVHPTPEPVVAPAPTTTPVVPEPVAPVAPTTTSVIDLEPLISQIADVRAQLQSADIPRILANIDELRAGRQTVTLQTVTRLQDQVSKLVGQINTLQDRVSVIEGRLAQFSPGGTETTTRPVVEAITSVVGAAAAQGATHVLNRAAMKLEDMVSPGALYNLRKVSDRGPVKYAW